MPDDSEQDGALMTKSVQLSQAEIVQIDELQRATHRRSWSDAVRVALHYGLSEIERLRSEGKLVA